MKRMNMLRKLATIVLLVVTLVLLVMLGACGGDETPTEEPPRTASATLEQTTQDSEATSPPEEGSDEVAEGEPTEAILEAVVSRTPEPTVTPGVVTEAVEEVIDIVGLGGYSFLGLSADEWINLVISIVIILLGYTLGNLLVKTFLRWVVRRTKTDFDNKFLETVGDELRWLVTFIAAQFALLRLAFLGETLLAIITDVIFIIYIILFARMSLKLLDFAIEYYLGIHEEELEAKPGRNTLILLAKRAGAVVIVILYIAILLEHFGINITGLAAALGIAGLAFSLAAQDTISDAISGVIIMLAIGIGFQLLNFWFSSKIVLKSYGARILEPVPALADAVSIVLQHHEHYDGKGYPQGLVGEEIHLGARILMVADYYDAMRSARPYRPPGSREEVVDSIAAEAGKKFDPQVVGVFLQLMREEGERGEDKQDRAAWSGSSVLSPS